MSLSNDILEAVELNKYSKTLTQDPTQPAAQAMLYGIGLTDDDLKKAQVGVASMGYDGNPCNMHLNDLAKLVKHGIWEEGLVGLIFHTIGVSDGMSMGTDGMRYSLVSRDVIADSIEAVCGAQYYDGLITLPGCDKNGQAKPSLYHGLWGYHKARPLQRRRPEHCFGFRSAWKKDSRPNG